MTKNRNTKQNKKPENRQITTKQCMMMRQQQNTKPTKQKKTKKTKK